QKQEDFSYDKVKEHSDYKKALEILSSQNEYAKKWLDVFKLADYVLAGDSGLRVSSAFLNQELEYVSDEYDLILTTNVNEQMGTYVNATTTRLTKRFLDCAKESPPKRLAKEIGKNEHGNPFATCGTPNKSDTDESYHPSSDESSSDSYMEFKKEKPEYIYEWFTGQGIKESNLSDGAKKWIINTFDVSNLLLEYRNMSVQKASDHKIEEVAEILSLNHIFLFEENASAGIQEMIDPQSLKIIFENIKNEFTPYQLSDNDILRCYKMAKTANQNFRNCKQLLRRWQKQVEDDQEDLILEVFESM
ncbi:1528_t:CDS:2, partial [Acaulospora colombiana]